MSTRALILRCHGSPGRGGAAPRRLRLYANRPTGVGFDEAEVLKPQLDLALLDGETSVAEYPLRVAVFSNVFSISLFFVSLIKWTDEQNDNELNIPIWQSESNEEEMSRIYYVSSFYVRLPSRSGPVAASLSLLASGLTIRI
jgi:PITH domain